MSFSAITIEQLRHEWQLPNEPVEVHSSSLVPVIDKGSLQAVYVAISPIEHFQTADLFQECVYALPQYLKNKPVFFSRDKMVRDGRYQPNFCTFLKLYVPQSAIVAQESHLYLDTSQITQDHLHGCYVRTRKAQHYYRNPYFNSWFEKLYYGQ